MDLTQSFIQLLFLNISGTPVPGSVYIQWLLSLFRNITSYDHALVSEHI